ncbi:MAG: hypothetical protein KatS3mg016_1067 [Fimbriimonadales bacterium]|nr:MAG: hypothetical protein KatS3mg016_1067 [Fimbriimonadales bacterium]
MFEQNGSVNGELRRDKREPIFRDVPFEQSEWVGLYEVLRQVNVLKAELIRPQYEAARTAFQNYCQAREQEITAYAQRRQDDEAYNREVYERRQQILAQIDSIRQRWQGEIDRLREKLDDADAEAYRRAGLAGITLRGDPLLGIGLPEEVEPTTEGQAELTESTASDAPPQNAQAQLGTTATASSPAQSPPSERRIPLLSRLLPQRSDTETDTASRGEPSSQGSAPTSNPQSEATAKLPDPIEPLTPEEAAHAAHLPTNQALVIPYWLHWLAPLAIGVALGQILLVVAGIPLDWETPAFWIASIGEMLAVLLWYRAVWGVSRAISELYYLFDWGALKARRAARLGGLVLLLLLILPTALLVSVIYWLPTVRAGDVLLLAVLALLAILPLLGLAMVGGYLQGREQVVRNAIQSAVVAAKREQQQRERASSEPVHQEDPSEQGLPEAPSEQIRLELERERTEQMRIQSELERERFALERLRLERGETSPLPLTHEGNTLASEPLGSVNGGHATVNGATATTPSETPSSDRRQRLQDAFEAISYARGIYGNFLRAQEMLRAELAPYEQMLHELQPRPIYDYLPPWAEERLQTLYQQWCDAYGAFLNYVAEATRECKDGEQIQQRIAEYKQRLSY